VRGRHRGHHRPHGPPHGRRGPRRFFRARLHRRLFIWFGLTIIATAITVSVAQSVLAGPSGWKRDVEGALRFVSSRIALVYDDETARAEILTSIASELRVGVVLRAEDGAVIDARGECRRAFANQPVLVRGQRVARLEICADPRAHGRSGGRGLVGLVVALITLWALSGALARRLLRPLREAANVAERIGHGELDARVDVRRHAHGEVGHVGRAMNEMAERIQRQLDDQKELLAAVSHEMRTPLGHLRVVTEMLRERLADPTLAAKHIDDIEREITEMDDLVGQLLASSRLDFKALATAPVDPLELGRAALERAGLGGSLLSTSGEPSELVADANLLLRALANLLDNARRHGSGVARLVIETDGQRVRFAVEDEGEGFSDADRERAFAAFFSRDKSEADGKGSLGLGLALVRRIAEAHGGDVFVESPAGGGARVGFTIPRV
jgi:signal transduction histidine kinase